MRVTLTHGFVWLDAAAPSARADEGVLVERARAGDGPACRALYRQHGPRIRRFLGDLLRDGSLADDATQETFARVFRRLPTLDDPSRFTGWLFGVARNVGLEARKARARRARVLQESGEMNEAASDTTPERSLLEREAATILQRALSKLPEDRKAALLMRVDHQLAYAEIAAALGWSLAKAKVEVHRARAALRAVLAAEGECP